MLRVIFILLLAMPVLAATYYLDIDATGANNGGSGNDAWQTIAQCLTDLDALGDNGDGTGQDIEAGEIDDILADTAAYDTDAERLAATAVASGTLGATGNSETKLHLDTLVYADDQLNNRLIRIYDDSASRYYFAWITDWDLASELATVATLGFTPEASVDTYLVFTTSQLDVSAASLADIGDAVRTEPLTIDEVDGTIGHWIRKITGSKYE